MSATATHADVLALRRRSVSAFEAFAAKYFQDTPAARSIVLAVSQYFADEAGDAVHEHVIAFTTELPTWPHDCDTEAEPPADGSTCSRCGDMDRLWFSSLDSNSEAVLAWSAFCTEWGGGEGESSRVDPVLIARRGPAGAVSLEWVHEVVRPWLDDNAAGQARDREFWDEDPLPPAPEPARPEWTVSERGLFEAVLAKPRDDGPRRVLIDHWLERNDVRGEYGALCFGPNDEAAMARRFHLELEHGRAWLGPLQAAVTLGGMGFGRGPFAHRVGVFVNPRVDAAAVVDLPEWALVEAIDFVSDRFVFSRHMRGLVELTGLTGTALELLEQSGLEAPIATVGFSGGALDASQWASTLGGVTRLLLEDQTAPVSAAWSRLPWWSRLKDIEVWFSLAEDVVPWNDERAEQALARLGPTLPVGARLTVGYHLPNGRRAGTVARLAQGGAVQFVDLTFATRGRMQRNEEPPGAPSEPSAEKPSLSLFQRLFGRR